MLGPQPPPRSPPPPEEENLCIICLDPCSTRDVRKLLQGSGPTAGGAPAPPPPLIPFLPCDCEYYVHQECIRSYIGHGVQTRGVAACPICRSPIFFVPNTMNSYVVYLEHPRPPVGLVHVLCSLVGCVLVFLVVMFAALDARLEQGRGLGR